MKYRCIAVAVMAIILQFPVFADSLHVSIYSRADEKRFGQTFSRDDITSFELEDFNISESVEVEDGGILTAVIVSGRVKTALDALLNDRDYIFIDESVLSRAGPDGKAYEFIWDKYGFEIVFSLEKAGNEILSIIDRTYSRNAYLAGELRRSYSDDCVVNILRAEDVEESNNGIISFKEALIAATVIGDTFQPLYGIHDGLGILDSIGLVTSRIDLVTEGELVEYRNYKTDDKHLRSFIHQIKEMKGDFVDNLYMAISAVGRKHSDDGMIKLPEEFFHTKEGDNPDYALFYYDILKRTGYEVKYIVIDPGAEDGELFATVFFKEKGADLWGRIDSSGLEREKAERVSRMPALVFSASVRYFEPDIEEVFNTAAIRLPPPSKWQTSLY